MPAPFERRSEKPRSKTSLTNYSIRNKNKNMLVSNPYIAYLSQDTSLRTDYNKRTSSSRRDDFGLDRLTEEQLNKRISKMRKSLPISLLEQQILRPSSSFSSTRNSKIDPRKTKQAELADASFKTWLAEKEKTRKQHLKKTNQTKEHKQKAIEMKKLEQIQRKADCKVIFQLWNDWKNDKIAQEFRVSFEDYKTIRKEKGIVGISGMTVEDLPGYDPVLEAKKAAKARKIEEASMSNNFPLSMNEHGEIYNRDEIDVTRYDLTAYERREMGKEPFHFS